MRRLQPDIEGFRLAAAAINAGEVVVYPTDTVYGLAVDPMNTEALRKLFEVKGRPDTNPILLIVSEISYASSIAFVSPIAQAFMDHFWPGPLSLTLPARPGIPTEVTAGGSKVAVRCPACSIARALCQAFGGALTSTSANRSGCPPAMELDGFDLPGVTLAVDGGALPPALSSTVYDPDLDVIHREGAVSAGDLAAFRAGLPPHQR